MDALFKLKILFIVCLTFLFFSCGIGPVKWEGFTNYKFPICDDKLPIKIDGIYVEVKDTLSKNIGIRNVFFLYENGKCYNYSINRDFWMNPNKVLLNSKKTLSNLNYHKDLGEYKIVNDTINFQTFGENNNEVYSKWIVEDKAIITSDTTFTIVSWYSYLGDDFLKEERKFQLFRTKIKPDSSNFFYKKKKWYLKKVHNSRKQK
jgi:hypothetical protein